MHFFRLKGIREIDVLLFITESTQCHSVYVTCHYPAMKVFCLDEEIPHNKIPSRPLIGLQCKMQFYFEVIATGL